MTGYTKIDESEMGTRGLDFGRSCCRSCVPRKMMLIIMKCLNVRDGRIVVSFRDGSNREVLLSEIAVIGEYTTEDGPSAADHFICVVDRSGNRYDVSYEEGASEVVKEFSDIFGVPLVPTLGLETQFSSLILYPSAISGKPLFVPPKSPSSIIGRVRAFFGTLSHPLNLSSEAVSVLR